MSKLLYFQNQKFTHRQSGLCLDEPIINKETDNHQQFKILNGGDAKNLPKIPSLQKCSRGKPTQRWLLNSVSWLPDDLS